MKLFQFVDFKLTISEEALLIKPFRKIWNRDRSDGKLRAMLELGYIYFMCDPRSDYMYIIDEKDRAEIIKEQEGLEDWKPDVVIEEGMEVYQQLSHTISSNLLKDVRTTVDNLREHLVNINFDERDDKNKPIYTIGNVVTAIKSIPALVTSLIEAEHTVNKELEEKSRIRGQGTKKIFEDGF